MLNVLIDAIRDWVTDVLTNFYQTYLGYVTPQMFGAKGDGVTDDSEALRRMFAHEGVVRVPKGTYLLTAYRNLNSIQMSPSLHIIGEGYDESIIKLVYTDSTKQHGLIPYGNNTNFTMEKIAIIDEKHGDDPVYISGSPDANTLFYPKGVFKNLILDNVKIHSGGDSNYLGQYAINVMYVKCSADTMIIRNCVFENFTNIQWGSCMWYESWDDTASLPKYIENIIIDGNIFRHTCSDEAVAVYASVHDPDKTRLGYKNVTITNNQVLHQNFNGECHTTSYQMAINASHVAYEYNNANVVVSGNKFVIDKSAGAPFHSTGGRVIFENNQIVILSAVWSKSVEKGNYGSGFVLCRNNKCVVRNNHFIGRAPFYVIEKIQCADATYSGNIYDVHGGFVEFVVGTPESGEGVIDEAVPHQLVITGNTFNYDSNMYLKFAIHEDINQGQLIIFSDNKLTGGMLRSIKNNGSHLIIKRNTFNYLTPDAAKVQFNWTWDANNFTPTKLSWIENENAYLAFYGLNTEHEDKLQYLEYKGIQDGLRISAANGGDTAANRNKIADASNITYTDTITLLSFLPTPSVYYLNKQYLITGESGGLFKCVLRGKIYLWEPVPIGISGGDTPTPDPTPDPTDDDPTTDVDFNNMSTDIDPISAEDIDFNNMSTDIDAISDNDIDFSDL